MKKTFETEHADGATMWIDACYYPNVIILSDGTGEVFELDHEQAIKFLAQFCAALAWLQEHR